MNSTAEAIYVSNADEYIREECWLREERIAHEEYQKKQFEKLINENTYLTNEVSSLSDEVAHLK